MEDESLGDSLDEISNGHGNDEFDSLKAGAKTLSGLRANLTAQQDSARSLRGSSKRKVNIIFYEVESLKSLHSI